MKTFGTIIYFIAICFLFISCRKYYPENPRSLWDSKKYLPGRYHVTKYTVDDIDSSSHIKPSGDSGICTINYSERYVLLFGNNLYNLYGSIYMGKIGDKNIQIYIDEKANTVGPFVIRGTTNWEVRKLYKNDFWLKKEYNNKIYYLELKKF